MKLFARTGRSKIHYNMLKTPKQILGTWGEEAAVVFLEQQGYSIIERNFRINGGEIDIIGQYIDQAKLLVWSFIEVKTRSYGEGSAERATGKEKLSRLKKAARVYCLRHSIDMSQTSIQFEQISLYIDQNKKNVECTKYIIPVN